MEKGKFYRSISLKTDLHNRSRAKNPFKAIGRRFTKYFHKRDDPCTSSSSSSASPEDSGSLPDFHRQGSIAYDDKQRPRKSLPASPYGYYCSSSSPNIMTVSDDEDILKKKKYRRAAFSGELGDPRKVGKSPKFSSFRYTASSRKCYDRVCPEDVLLSPDINRKLAMLKHPAGSRHNMLCCAVLPIE